MITDVRTIETTLPPPVASMPADALERVEHRLRTAHANHLGYPYNLAGAADVPPRFGNYLINNLGDPYAGSHYASEVCDLEREAVDWLMELWGCEDREAYWGSVGASGTEGNLWALYLAREAFPDAIVVYPREAHYSIPKAARILRIGTQVVDCLPNGEISLIDLRRVLLRLRSAFAIVALTCGTTVKGAHDDIAGVLDVLDDAGFPPHRRYVHVDGALNGMVLPFLEGVPDGLQPSFRHGVSSIST